MSENRKAAGTTTDQAVERKLDLKTVDEVTELLETVQRRIEGAAWILEDGGNRLDVCEPYQTVIYDATMGLLFSVAHDVDQARHFIGEHHRIPETYPHFSPVPSQMTGEESEEWRKRAADRAKQKRTSAVDEELKKKFEESGEAALEPEPEGS